MRQYVSIVSDTPLWVKVFVAAGLAVAIVAVIVIAAGGHAPRRHGADHATVAARR